ncbi:molecular chaperone [Vibrio cholerae]|uniref:molecular chaperone n=1 Tax=Vibrio cholerae TaxID=666 RepID=UPI001E40896A|nr:molecular chaperone [Vibrio cholerae]EHD7118207.1 molecular chaperone [Vibrio cholerae]EJL6942788.1 molecular chaperone [Vibrio cholerae]MCD1219021.1 molecular chaperone [Vibrio cholerae]
MLINTSMSFLQSISSRNNIVAELASSSEASNISLLVEDFDKNIGSRALRNAVASIAKDNKEEQIANSLIDAIDKHTIELEVIGNWTEGGLSAFKGALEMMAEDILNKSNLSGADYENLMQIAMLDVLANLDEYGLSGSEKFKQFLAWSIEYSGSGQHNSWINTLPDPATCTGDTRPRPDNNANGCLNNNLVKIMNEVWKSIKVNIDNKTIPENSLVVRLMQKLSGGQNISNTLPSSVYDDLKVSVSGNSVNGNGGYFDVNNAGWITNSNNNMSPLMRLVTLSNLLERNPELSKNQLDVILFGDLKTINDLVKEEIPGTDNVYKFIIEFDNVTRAPLTQDNQGWQDSSYNHDTDTRPNGVTISLDFAGELDTNWLSRLSNNYPKRVLGDEDIKEINRLGDSVKMIMQTLKYWFQIMRDERVAIARNI